MAFAFAGSVRRPSWKGASTRISALVIAPVVLPGASPRCALLTLALLSTTAVADVGTVQVNPRGLNHLAP